ncbi:MAG: hypothetical protein J5666_00840 [Bacilli bacterium]|nr:hypothetical protein [Bacilli bacterium]
MGKSNYIYHYYVEGECEEKLLNTYKVPPYLFFQSGKVEVFNFINKRITNQRLMTLKKRTIIILVYDIDIEKTEVLEENIKRLKECGFEVYHVQSIKNFEDEIVYSTSLKNINEMYETTNKVTFKKRFLSQSDLDKRLEKVNFNHSLIWSRINTSKPFAIYSNQRGLDLIKKK